ncbi:MAG: DUF1634 domain-containing protein [Cyanobacteria bacterium SZAS TMP-1]|nr:DUF1634 domain-containing protein [Cyanobacteria bacterium SZAS TMP-1]
MTGGNTDLADNKDMQLTVSRMLNLGLVLSSLVVLIGGVLLMVERGSIPIDFKALHGEALTLASLPAIVARALSFEPTAVIQIGLFLLVATPFARVALSIVLFLKKADYLYVGITSLVLLILIFAVSGNH